MKKDSIRLYEGKVIICDDGIPLKYFFIYTYGIKRYYHTTMNQVVQKWVKTLTELNQATTDSLCKFIRKNYPEMVVFSKKDIEHYQKYQLFTKRGFKKIIPANQDYPKGVGDINGTINKPL